MEQARTDKCRAVYRKDRLSMAAAFPPYQTVYSFFSRGAKSGLWEEILAHLVEKTRKDAGKSAEPHYALIDSQSVKTVADNEKRGIDGGKKQKGANVMPS